MIVNWDEMSNLHVIHKLRQILMKWFGVELFYANEFSKIQGNLYDKNYKYQNYFMKVQMGLTHGHEILNHDIEKITEQFAETTNSYLIFESFFPGIKGVACKLRVEGENAGTIFAYPFLSEHLTTEEGNLLKQKLIECGCSIENAETAMSKLRGIDKTEKEYLHELVELVSEEIVSFHQEIEKREARILQLNSELGTKYRYHSMIGKSKQMQQIYGLLEKISRSESTVLIQGDNGTGKELVAKAIHYSSPRKDSMFLAQNCSAFNDNLLDSELFGHVKGAFTGAIKDKKGLFETAHAGTLFLDEIGDTSLTMQVKLLRVLQEGTFLPVGATSPKKVNVRILAATNRDLKQMIQNGEFREDLYYRINVINIHLPALRERKEDIPFLFDHFLQKKCEELALPTKTVSKKCLEKILDYPWPGNVRELENEVERLVVLAGDSKTIGPEVLSTKIIEFGQTSVSINAKGIRFEGNLKEATEELEIIMIKEGLRRCNFNKSKLAKELGMSRASLIMKVEKYGLDKRSVTDKRKKDFEVL